MFRGSIVLLNNFRYIDSSFVTQTIRIAPEEYQWVNEVISASRNSPSLESTILKWKPYHPIPAEILTPSGLDKHSGGRMIWTMMLAQEILDTKSEIVSAEIGGLRYDPL
jgi:hypothetical protein